MTYPDSCFNQLIGLKGQCEPQAGPMYWLDDIPGLDITKLANLATTEAATGANLGKKIIDTAARLMAADVEAIYDGRYKVMNTLVSGCSLCTLGSAYLGGAQRGVLIKNNTESSYASLVVEKLSVKINASGVYTIVLDDGSVDNVRQIPYEFQAQVLHEFTNVGYSTKESKVRIYMLEDVPLAQLSCPRSGSGCGCSGKSSNVLTDLSYTGTFNGDETQQAYGFIPCAMIKCEAADLLCTVATSAPRMIGMALLFKAAAQYFSERLESVRNNKIAGTNVDEVKENVKKYEKLYLDHLNGKDTRGVKDIVFTTLQQINDVCVVCNSMMGTSWATG